jgi:hypothetical protein
MSITDYLLILVVFRQLRGRRLAGVSLFLPLVLVAYAAVNYLHGIATPGSDLLLVLGGSAPGLLMGGLSATFTRVYPGPGGEPFAKATGWAIFFWVVGIGARLAFAVYAQNGGGPTMARFSVSHHLTISFWVTGLMRMTSKVLSIR